MSDKAMGLSECARFDHANGARNKLTGWGAICKLREAQKTSRKHRRARREAEAARMAAESTN